MLLKKTSLTLRITLLLSLSTNLACMETTHTPNSLVADPLLHLNKMNTTFDAFEKEFHKLKKSTKKSQLNLATLTQEYTSLVQKHEQVCPLFLLGECIDNENCLLSRTCKPKFRAAFEKHTSQLLIDKLQSSPTTPVNYTSFGCGDAFQDLIIITKALIEQPKALLTIHMIDGNNTPYVNAIDFLDYSRKIIIDQIPFSFGSRLAEYAKYARDQEKDDPEIQSMTDKKLQQLILLLCLEKEAQYKQFLSWLTQQFSLAKISLYLHSQVINYSNFLEKNKFTHADIVTTADIDDEESLIHASLQHYTRLCTQTLNAKPTSKTAWLKKINNNSAGITTVHLLLQTQKGSQIGFEIKEL
jgi:hypothetical protein